MPAQTYSFVPDGASDSDDADDTVALLEGQPQQKTGTVLSKQGSSPSSQTLQSTGENNNNNKNESQLPQVMIRKKKKDRSKIKVKSVKDGVKKLEKHELAKKRRVILYQLVAVSVIAMLHGLSMVPHFWNSILLNIYDLQTQTVTLWCLLGTCFLFSCALTPLVLKRFPLRWILCYSCFTTALFTGARFYPRLYLMVPASILHGLSLIPFYTAVFSHISKLSVQYEGYQGKSYKQAVISFTAVCTAILSCAPFLLSLFRVIIIHTITDNTPPPATPSSSECGFNYLWNWMDKVKLDQGLSPEHYEVQAVLGACLVCALGAIVLIFVVLEELQLPSNEVGDQADHEVALFWDKFKDADHILLFPIAFAVGMFETFCYTLYGQAFVACNFDLNDIFYTVLGMSLAAMAVASLAVYFLPRVSTMKITVPVFIGTLLALMITILGGYMPYAMFYVLTVLFGVINYLLLTQITAFILLHFLAKLEVSFTVFHLAKLSAFLVTFILVRYHGDNSTCTGAVLASLLIGLICYVVLELRRHLQPMGEEAVGGSVGAYVLLEANKSPWQSVDDSTAIDMTQAETVISETSQE